MYCFRLFFIGSLLFHLISGVCAQEHKIGEVTISDLEQRYYTIDSNAQAIVLYDYCTVKYEPDGSNNNFGIKYQFHKRIKLLNKNAFDLATVEIPLNKYVGRREDIAKLEAVTYYLEAGEIKKKKIDKSAIFKDKVVKDVEIYKFTFPNVKEGAIIDYTYTLFSPSPYYIKAWYFQGDYPVLWSEYDVHVPSIFTFFALHSSNDKFEINKMELEEEDHILGSTIVKLAIRHSTWARANLPALKPEKYISTLKNYMAKTEFQLSTISYPDSPVIPFLKTWKETGETLMKDDDFGKELYAKNNWMKEEPSMNVSGETNDLQKAKKVYALIRDQFTCSDYDAILLSKPLRKTWADKTGNVADINLLLTAFLRNKGLDAKPVFLSTRPHGRAYEAYPLVKDYDYLICRLLVDSVSYLLDASRNMLGFGKIPADSYNGSGRIIDSLPVLIPLDPVQIMEKKSTIVNVQVLEDGQFLAKVNSAIGYYESEKIREKFIHASPDAYFKEVKKSYPFELTLGKQEIIDLENYDKALSLKYDFTFSPEQNEKLIYFHPLLNENIKLNPLKSDVRLYPIEMPYASSESYQLQFKIPMGYQVEEMPKPTKAMFGNGEATFDYLIQKTGEYIQLRSKIEFKKVFFEAKEYQELRDFFAYIVKIQSEQIVLKKNP